jgi:Mycothiol maleylpyruvate isomerase N-terminal domain
MRATPSPSTVLQLYDEGVDALVETTMDLDADGWARAACGRWTATDVARHVTAVVGWYHDWLDRAEAGDAEPAFAIADLAQRNAQELARPEFACLDGPAAVHEFTGRARAYRDRLPAAWDLPYGYPRGRVTAGLHAAIAACEWHFHAWDLAGARGGTHRPSDPATLHAGAAACLARAEGWAQAGIAAALIPLGARLRPWEALLRRSGRAPRAGD